MKEEMLSVQPVIGTTGMFTISLFEKYGTCHIEMISSSLWRPQQSQLILCKGIAVANNPDVSKWWQPTKCSNPASTDLIMGNSVWDTGQPWGVGYSAAMIAQNICGDYLLVTSTPVTQH